MSSRGHKALLAGIKLHTCRRFTARDTVDRHVHSTLRPRSEFTIGWAYRTLAGLTAVSGVDGSPALTTFDRPTRIRVLRAFPTYLLGLRPCSALCDRPGWLPRPGR